MRSIKYIKTTRYVIASLVFLAAVWGTIFLWHLLGPNDTISEWWGAPLYITLLFIGSIVTILAVKIAFK